MITLINENKMTLKNYDNIFQIKSGDLECYMVDWNLSLDNKPIINFFTLEMDEPYKSDVI